MAYMQQRQDPFIGNAERMAQPPMSMQPIQQYGIQEPFYGQPGGNMQQQLMNAAPMTMSAMQPMNGFTPSMAYGGMIPQYEMSGLTSLRGGGNVPMIYSGGGYIPGYGLGGFFKGLGKFALKAAPYAAMFTPGGPWAAAAVAAATGALEKKLGIDQESWGDVLHGRTVEKTPTSWKDAGLAGVKKGAMAYAGRKLGDAAREGWGGPARQIQGGAPGEAGKVLEAGPGLKGALAGVKDVLPSSEHIIKYGPLVAEMMDQAFGPDLTGEGGFSGNVAIPDGEILPASSGLLSDKAQGYAHVPGKQWGGEFEEPEFEEPMHPFMDQLYNTVPNTMASMPTPSPTVTPGPVAPANPFMADEFEEPMNPFMDQLSSALPYTTSSMNQQPDASKILDDMLYRGSQDSYDPMLDIPEVGRLSNERDEEAAAAERAAIEDNKLISARAELERLRLEELNRSQFDGRSPGELGENTDDTPYDPMLDIPQVTSQSPLKPTVTELMPPGPNATQEEKDAWNNYLTAEGDRQRAVVAARAAADAAAKRGDGENTHNTTSSVTDNTEPDDPIPADDDPDGKKRKKEDVAPSGKYDKHGNLIVDPNYKPTYYTPDGKKPTPDGKKPTNTYSYNRERKPDALATAGLKSKNSLGPAPWDLIKEMPEGYQAGLMSEGKLSPVTGHNPFSMPQSGFGTDSDAFLASLKGGNPQAQPNTPQWQPDVTPTFDAQGNPTTAGVRGIQAVPGSAEGGPISAMDTVNGGPVPQDYPEQSGNVDTKLAVTMADAPMTPEDVGIDTLQLKDMIEWALLHPVEGEEMMQMLLATFGEELVASIAHDMQNPNATQNDKDDRLVELETRKRLAQGEPVIPQAMLAGGEVVYSRSARELLDKILAPHGTDSVKIQEELREGTVPDALMPLLQRG